MGREADTTGGGAPEDATAVQKQYEDEHMCDGVCMFVHRSACGLLRACARTYVGLVQMIEFLIKVSSW